jgi:ribonuclease P protein subunit POP4
MFGGMLIDVLAQITESSNKNMLGLKGKIVDETKNTLIIICNDSRKVIPKSIVSLELYPKNGSILRLKGSELLGTPQERLGKS